MKISKLIKLTNIMIVVFSSAAVAAALLSNAAAADMRRAFEEREKFTGLGLELTDASVYLTRQAQTYIQYGEKKYYDAYMKELSEDKRREAALEGLRGQGAPEGELKLVIESDELSDKLREIEKQAFAEVVRQNWKEARALIYGGQYAELQEPITRLMDEFKEKMDARTGGQVARTKKAADFYSAVSLICTVMLAALGIIGFTLIRKKIRPISRLAQAAHFIAEGEMSAGFSSDSKDEIGELTEAFRKVASVISSLIEDISALAARQAAGETSYFADESAYSGAYRDLARAVNLMCANSVEDLTGVINAVTGIAGGSFGVEVKDMPGEKAAASSALRLLKENIGGVGRDLNGMVESALRGDFSARADASRYNGDWRRITAGLNELFQAVEEPIQQIKAAMRRVSLGDFSKAVEGDYKGEFLLLKNAVNETVANIESYIGEISGVLGALNQDDLDQGIKREYLGEFSGIKDALNEIIDKFNKIMSEIYSVADSVASGAKSISESSMDLAKSASTQASSVEELSATIIMINESAIKNADCAREAVRLAAASKDNADSGNREMDNMLASMEGINNSSSNIAKIIQVIDDVAVQTNLLALNASVEAARAGEHGKGFAVVSEEVRSLAGRSASASKEITASIAESIGKVSEGSKIADMTATAFHSIRDDIEQVSALISSMANTAGEQAEAVGQVTEGVTRITGAISNNSATSEETAAASEELFSQAELLRSLAGKFKLKK
ncbi:MAG: methyl-accepting chemotaxis protein [Clostridiales bacterium]|jgi:methyl-accepting chemotaxis protein|nr:methyl-accepting chemotaxis protein [Clostridiales bacterium]